MLVSVFASGLLLGVCHNIGLLVVTDPLLEEISLARQGDVVHEVEWVRGIVMFLVPKSNKESVGNKLNVLAHELGVHPEQGARKGVRQEFLLDNDSLSDDGFDGLRARTVAKVREKEASEISMKTLIARNELVGERQARHEPTLLQPEDGREGTTEENTLNSSERDKSPGKGGFLIFNPLDGPISLLADAGNCETKVLVIPHIPRDGCDKGSHTSVNSIKQEGSLLGLLDVRVDEKRVCFGVDVLHHDLETVETTRLGNLDLAAEAFDKVLIHDTV